MQLVFREDRLCVWRPMAGPGEDEAYNNKYNQIICMQLFLSQPYPWQLAYMKALCPTLPSPLRADEPSTLIPLCPHTLFPRLEDTGKGTVEGEGERVKERRRES